MKIYNNITEVFGNTPLVQLNHITDGAEARVLAKLEFYNPSSSVKDRLGIAMVDSAEASGELQPGGTIIEATSGNTGISLAMVGAARGYRTIIVMPDSMSLERKILIRAYGAELILTPAAEGMTGSVAKAEELGRSIEGAVMVRQFENEAGPEIHRNTTAEEIWRDTEGKVAAFVAGSGTGGTITGTSQRLKQHNPKIKTFAVQPAASPLLTGGKAAGHPLAGIGPNFIPKVLDPSSYDEVISVENDKAFEFARRASSEEGILAGISSGAALYAAREVARRPEFAGKIIVVLVPSFGERYVSSTLYRDLQEQYLPKN
ncbi:cysteine synthase A [Candidatus Aquiluna sp. UB-MaderosW2red]|uniref:cysteine synthase A n=1 Tax=Candidatus Aquiluna sp. UB-MaderosW2red TaxID=1855377 RepID=UPI000875CA25|nr:cysteine synthase A [Candidatus Aquiluna sp. UB-MaderosW2red]SCX08985.1 cysteine synthase A [Candidatus Aquiluna sp. UB-MaderosW2red]